MKLSLNEIAGMIHKAARGAGIPLGHCDELASAGALLIARGGQTGDISHALGETSGVALNGPIAIDAVLVEGGEVRMKNVTTPDLMVAMVDARRVAVTATRDGADVILRAGENTVDHPTGAFQVSAVDWAIWADLAAKTYVPASEESRLSGAGAGLTDND